MAHDEALADRLRTALAHVPGVTEKKMFGGLSFLLGGHMIGGVTGKGDLVFRFDPKDHDAALGEPHVREMDLTGRPIRGFVFVSPAVLEEPAGLGRWIERAVGWVSQLPPKKPAAPKPPKRRKSPA